MTILESRQELAKAVGEITNLKIIEIYREADYLNMAKEFDDVLVDLCRRITDMIAGYPRRPTPDEFGAWLLAGDSTATQLVVPDPPGELNTRVATTDQKPTESKQARVDEEPGPAGSGADPEPVQVDSDSHIHPGLTERLRAFKNDHHLSNMRIAKVVGVSDVTIGCIIKGDHVSDKTAALVVAAISSYKPKGDQAKKPEPKKETVVDGVNAAEFIQAKLSAWLEAEDLDAASASEALQVSEHALLSILKGHIPHNNVIYELAKYIPEIKAQQSMLVAAAEQQEAA